jgi:ABC-type transport system involved in multi-copper enzyme maturation permease subunit
LKLKTIRLAFEHREIMVPIIRRELLELLRSPKAAIARLVLAIGCCLLVLIRWPTGEVADLSGARSLQVLRIFGYGLLAGVLLLVPAFPSTTLVREKLKGTLALLFNSPLTPLSIYLGKFLGVLGFGGLILLMTVPAAAACHAMGGGAVQGGIVSLYAILVVAIIQMTSLGLFVSSRAQSPASALRITYALMLLFSVIVLAPYAMIRGEGGLLEGMANWIRCLSPVPPVMEVLGQRDVGSLGMTNESTTVWKYLILAILMSIGFAWATITRLNLSMLDRARSAGEITDDQSSSTRLYRRLFYLIDPQRRAKGMSLWMNPVMVKEFLSRRFGRSHWAIRSVFICGILSLGLSLIATQGALGWGLEVMGGALVLLQVALLILFIPSLAASLISSELESGSWRLLQMTPLSPGRILRGKLLSVAWPILLILTATLPGYIVMMTVEPTLIPRVGRVVTCLVLTAIFAVLLSATISAFFRSTAISTTISYIALLSICIGPLLVWLGREAPFGVSTVEMALAIDPLAAALQASAFPGFAGYELLPLNWWIIGSACIVLLGILAIRTRQLYRPE